MRLIKKWSSPDIGRFDGQLLQVIAITRCEVTDNFESGFWIIQSGGAGIV